MSFCRGCGGSASLLCHLDQGMDIHDVNMKTDLVKSFCSGWFGRLVITYVYCILYKIIVTIWLCILLYFGFVPLDFGLHIWISGFGLWISEVACWNQYVSMLSIYFVNCILESSSHGDMNQQSMNKACESLTAIVRSKLFHAFLRYSKDRVVSWVWLWPEQYGTAPEASRRQKSNRVVSVLQLVASWSFATYLS